MKYADTQYKNRQEKRASLGCSRQRKLKKKKDVRSSPLKSYTKTIQASTSYMRYAFPDHKPCCPCCQFAAVIILNQNNANKRNRIQKKKKN